HNAHWRPVPVALFYLAAVQHQLSAVSPHRRSGCVLVRGERCRVRYALAYADGVPCHSLLLPLTVIRGLAPTRCAKAQHGDGGWSLLWSWLCPHRRIAQEKLPLSLGFFACVHHASNRGQALLPALMEFLVTEDPGIHDEPQTQPRIRRPGLSADLDLQDTNEFISIKPLVARA